MSESATPQANPTDEHKENYFNFHINGWTNFDPINETLSRLAEGIEQGNGFLTLVEVQRTESDLANIGDEEVRECFANMLAAKRLVKRLHELPKHLVDELRAALSTDPQSSPKKAAASVPNFPVNGESELRTKQWP
jgi:predicted component of type VI protein secretion system